jgi:23S rRNA (uracil1939-C5)-methyltransferase
MRKGDTIGLRLEKFVFGGKALGFYEGRAVFVWGGIPGEEVRVRIIRKKRDYLEGDLVEVVTPSPLRIPPEEEHYMSCSPWQIIDYPQEIQWKIEILKELFQRTFMIDIGDFELSHGRPYHYRNKLELNFVDTPEGVRIAFYRRQGRSKLPIYGCKLAIDSINRVALSIEEILRRHRIREDQLKTLTLRCNREGEVIGSLYVKEEGFPDLTGEVSRIGGLRGFKIVYSSPMFSASVVTEVLYRIGEEYLKERLLHREIYFSDLTFLQVNMDEFEKMMTDLRGFVSQDDRVYDIYSGVGAIGICLDAGEVTFVESEEESARLAEYNCKVNGLKNYRVIGERAEVFLRGAGEPSVVILDPPRAGLSKKIIKALLRRLPRRIIYVSCNQSTQARDVKMLMERYRISFFRAYNFFPRTPHIESLMVLDLLV